MDIKTLKDKILQLAIQGKLVPQDENDEPALDLLERIKEEKEQLIKEKIIKKEKPLPDITDGEKSFELPNRWEWCRLGDICKQITDGAHKTPKYIDSGIPFLSVKNISGGYIDFNDTKYISEEEHNSLISRCNPQKNDLLFCRIGTLGRFKVIDVDTEFSIFVSLGLIKLSNNIYPKYMEYVLNSPELYRQYYKIKVDGSHTSKLNLRDIPNLIIPLPSLEEQKRIVDKVDSLFKLIDELDNNKQDLLQNISDVRNKVLQLAIQGKLVSQDENDEPVSTLLEKIKKEKEQLIKDKVIKQEKPLPKISEDEKLFEIANGWEWCRLGELGICKTGTTPSTTVEEYFGGDIPFIKPADISSKGINYYNDSLTNLGMEKGRKIYENSLVMVCIGGSIGKNYFTDRICSCNQQINTLTPLQNIDSKLLHYICSSQFFYNNLIQTATGTATPIIKKSNWEQLVIPIPPLEEQKRIVSKLDTIMNYLDTLEKYMN